MMQCANCHKNETVVIDTRASGTGLRRRRKCRACGTRFTTYERIDAEIVEQKRPIRTALDYLHDAARSIDHVMSTLRAELRAAAEQEPAQMETKDE